jgi:hypothetical protein
MVLLQYAALDAALSLRLNEVLMTMPVLSEPMSSKDKWPVGSRVFIMGNTGSNNKIAFGTLSQCQDARWRGIVVNKKQHVFITITEALHEAVKLPLASALLSDDTPLMSQNVNSTILVPRKQVWVSTAETASTNTTRATWIVKKVVRLMQDGCGTEDIGEVIAVKRVVGDNIAMSVRSISTDDVSQLLFDDRGVTVMLVTAAD